MNIHTYVYTNAQEHSDVLNVSASMIEMNMLPFFFYGLVSYHIYFHQ